MPADRIVVAALYRFAPLPDYRELRGPLLERCVEYGVAGSLLLASEGINGTVAGSRKGIDSLLAHLRADPRLEDLEHKESFAESMPFLRMKVRLKKEIVTMGVDGVDPNERVGTYVNPEEWTELVRDPEVLVVDTRNDYEVELGTFEGAVNPDIATFREFPAYVREHLDPARHRKVAMFCTGGIRCEKASSYLLAQGFGEVYHLRGGILKYLEQVAPEDSAWRGDCFVFDERVAVDHDLNPADWELCRGCRNPVSEADKASPEYEEGICCPRCHEGLTREKRAGRAERQRQVELARLRGETHIGGTVARPNV